MKKFIESEVKIINNMFRQNNILAKVVKAENVLNSFIRYKLSLHASQSFTAVEKITRELSALLNKNRQRQRLPTTEIITSFNPNFALEVSHVKPEILQWSIRKCTNLPKDCLLAGISTIDSKPEIISFDKTPHVLIAGMTNAGKSVLLQMLVLSLAANSPDTQFVFIDLKNEDLVPFKKLPNVLSFNSDYRSAIDAIDFMLAEKNKRVENNVGNRIVLVIDELAQLATEKKNVQKLGDLISIGRSKRLNIIAATQSVTKDGGIGSMMKANFPCRLVGMVVPGMSAIATGLAGMQAHKLPGQGSFLRIEGNNNHRFQSYYISSEDVKMMVDYIGKQFSSGFQNGSEGKNRQFYTSEKETEIENRSKELINFPIGSCRSLTEDEKEKVRQLFETGISLTKLSNKVFGFKNGNTNAILKEVLNV